MWKRRLINFKPLMSGALPGRSASSQSPRPSQQELPYTAILTFLALPETGWQRSNELNHTHTMSLSDTSFAIHLFLPFASSLAV